MGISVFSGELPGNSSNSKGVINNMQKLIYALMFSLTASFFAVAQSGDYDKTEVFVGYSHGQVDTGIDADDGLFDIREREPFHGFNVSGVYNVHRYVGIKGDISGTYNNKNIDIPVPGGNVSFDANSSLYNFLGGVQFKDNASDARFKPFAHALIGAGHGRTKLSSVVCTVDCSGLSGTISETGFAGAFGGGLDIKLNDKIDLRAIQVDYNPIKFDNGTQHNVRFGIGLVF